MFACATEAPCSNIVSPMLQGLVDVIGGRMQFSSKQTTEKILFQTYAAVCNVLGSSVADLKSGCITVDGWSAALRAPIFGITWHYVDENWKMRCIPIATLNMGTAAKTGEQMRCIIEENLSENAVVGSDDIKVHTGTSDNEAATALAVDLLTNYVDSVRCVVHTLALCVNDVFENGTPWKKYLDHVNKITSYFNHHQKAAQLLMMKQLEEGVTRDCLKRLKHDVPTRWHSKLAAMSAYLCRLESISAVAQELSIPPADLPSLTSEQQDVLAEFITVLTEVRRVATQLEADKKVTMSRAPRLLRELYETLLIMSGSMLLFGSGSTDKLMFGTDVNDTDYILDVRALPSRSSVALYDKERDGVRLVRLRKTHPQSLAIKLADRIESRLESLWQRADPAAASWTPFTTGGDHLERDMQKARRFILFHIAAVMDVNECAIDFLHCSGEDKDAYVKFICKTVVREALELEESLSPSAADLEVVHSMFYNQMRECLIRTGRKEPGRALSYWRDVNQERGMISPVPFNTVARAALSAQASSAPAERLFSDLGRREGNQSQCLLTSALEMSEMIRVFVKSELQEIRLPQEGLLHPQAANFKRFVHKVAAKVVDM